MSNKIFIAVCFIILSSPVALLNGCWSKKKPVQLICITDLTASVEPQSQAECFSALQSAFKQLQRGSSLAIIPVTADAATESPGRALRFRVSEKREVYDADLKRLAREVAEKTRAMRDEAAANPFWRSDLLGALKQAEEEMAQGRAEANHALVILSDFVQDDATLRFKTDGRLKDEAAAAEFARKAAGERRLNLRNARVFLGSVRSRDLQDLPAPRRAAIRAFWRELLRQSGAGAVEEATDGPGLMPQFVQKTVK